VLRGLRRDLTAAIKARDRVAVAALRSTIAAIENAESVDVNLTWPSTTSSEHVAGSTAGVGSTDVERRVLSGGDVIEIVGVQVESARSRRISTRSWGSRSG
jgi:hypothetical protein